MRWAPGLVLAGWLAAAPCGAAPPVDAPYDPSELGLAVAPVSLALAARDRTAATTVTNASRRPITVQVRLFRWTTAGDDDVYVPSEDVDFSPAVFRLAPGAQQKVRLLASGPAPDREGAYRLFVDQLPVAGEGGLQLPIRMVLPVFMAPARPTPGATAGPAALSWSAAYDAAHRTVRLAVANAGGAHQRIVDLAYAAGGRSGAIRRGLAGYALAGQTRSWIFALPASPAAGPPPRTLTITGRLDSAPLRVEVELRS